MWTFLHAIKRENCTLTYLLGHALKLGVCIYNRTVHFIVNQPFYLNTDKCDRYPPNTQPILSVWAKNVKKNLQRNVIKIRQRKLKKVNKMLQSRQNQPQNHPASL